MQRLTAWRRSVSAVLRGCGLTRATAAPSSSSSYTSILPGNVERSNKVRWASSLPRLEKRLRVDYGLMDEPGLDIHIKTDNDNGVITITDSGIGMSCEALAYAVPLITAKFLREEIKDGSGRSSNLIGPRKVQERVEKLEVSTKSPNSSKQYVWEGELNSTSYTIYEETDPSRLIRKGTRLRLYLKRDDKGFEIAVKELASSNHLTRAGLALKLLDCIVLKDAKQDSRTSSRELDLLHHEVYYYGSGLSMDAQIICSEKMNNLMHLKSELLKREGGPKVDYEDPVASIAWLLY